MSRRSRPQYRPGLEWILGVAFPDTLTRPVRLAQGFTFVRCCGSPRASSPHGLTAPALASRDGRYCVQLPPARGCHHLAPRRTFTSNPVPMPGTPGRATPSPRRNRPSAILNDQTPPERPLSLAGNRSDNRSPLWTWLNPQCLQGPSQSGPLTDTSPGSARSLGRRVCGAASSSAHAHTHALFRTERQSFLSARVTGLPNRVADLGRRPGRLGAPRARAGSCRGRFRSTAGQESPLQAA
jgi:hypothetical protein